MERESFLVRIFWQSGDADQAIYRAEVVHIATGTRTICTDDASLITTLRARPARDATVADSEVESLS